MIIHGYTAWTFGVLALFAALRMFQDGLEAVADLITAHARRRDRPAEQLQGDVNVLCAHVYGDSIPELREAGLRHGRELYGDDAQLTVEDVGEIRTSATDFGQFHTYVTVRNTPRADQTDTVPAEVVA